MEDGQLDELLAVKSITATLAERSRVQSVEN